MNECYHCILLCNSTSPAQSNCISFSAQHQRRMSKSGEGNLAVIFRRGGSKKELYDGEPLPDKQELNQQLQQLAVAWSIPKARKGLAAAVWRPLVGAFEVIERGRQHFNGQGFMHQKKLYLNVEEAVFMLDQSELLLMIDSGAGHQQLLSMQEALQMMVSLGIRHGRLQVLAHLSRLGYHVRRHPACWYAAADQPAAAAWQVNPAWRCTDGLLPVQQRTLGAAVVTAAVAAGSKLQAEQQARKKRKMAETPPAAAATEAKPQGQMHQPCTGWWDRWPHWLEGITAVQPPPAAEHSSLDAPERAAARTAAAGGCVAPDGFDDVVEQDYHLFGVKLQQRFPNLKPLPTYKQCASQIQHQQALQQPANTAQQQEKLGGTQPQQGCWGQCSAAGYTAAVELVYDAVPCSQHFSYRHYPPAPLMSFAMVKDGCDCLPPLDELLHSIAAAANGTGDNCSSSNGDVDACTAAGGMVLDGRRTATGSEAAAAASKSLMVAMPDGSDVNYYELRLISLMNLLTNQK